MKSLSWAAKKKLQYSLGFFVVFLLLAGYPLYVVINSVFYNPPSCFDNVQNQDERGVDCGGVCARMCVGDIQDLSVVWSKMFQLGDGIYDIAAKINNPNDDAMLEGFMYTFRLYDEKGALLYEKEGTDYADTGELFVVFEPNVRTGNKKPYRSEFEIHQPLDWVHSEVETIPIKTRKKELIHNDTNTRLNVSLENTGIIDVFSDVDILAVISDIKNNPIGVSKTYIKSFMPGAEKNISFSWPIPLSEQTKDICNSLEDLPPELLYPSDIMLVFDRSGSMNDDGSDPPQPITDAKEAAKIFVSKMQVVDWGGIVSFATEASSPVDRRLISDHSKIISAIDSITIGEPDNEQHTNIGDGIKKAFDELHANGRDTAKKAIVLLTDGIASRPLDQMNAGNENYPEEYAVLQAQNVRDADMFLYIVGLGNGINESFLKNKIATTEDRYYKAATSDELAEIYSDIARAVCEEDVYIIEIFVRVHSPDGG